MLIFNGSLDNSYHIHTCKLEQCSRNEHKTKFNVGGRRRSSVHPNDMLTVTGELMNERIVKDRRGSGHSTSSMDSETRKNTAMNSGFAGRRKTLKAMKKDFNKNKGKQKFVK